MLYIYEELPFAAACMNEKLLKVDLQKVQEFAKEAVQEFVKRWLVKGQWNNFESWCCTQFVLGLIYQHCKVPWPNLCR